jgi:isocitrate lyase
MIRQRTLAARSLASRTLARRAVNRSFQNKVFLPMPYSTLNKPEIFASAFPSSDSFQLLSTETKAGPGEDELFEQQVKQIEAWWASPRFAGIKRPYSAREVATKMGTLQQAYPSSVMARKLFDLLNERAESGSPVHTSQFLVKGNELAITNVF